MTALLLGTVLSVLALSFVLFPLFSGRQPTASRRVSADADESSPSRRALAALREVEFDRETGKLSDEDYAALRAEYTSEALAAMRAEGSAQASPDEVEAVILKYRARQLACGHCGPRPETDALYCSACGRYLAGACGSCGAAITEVGARYCLSCGKTLAA